MSDDADKVYTTEEFLDIITECGQEEARRLLRISRNNLNHAIELFFAEKVKMNIEVETKTYVDVAPENNLSRSVEVGKYESVGLLSRSDTEKIKRNGAPTTVVDAVPLDNIKSGVSSCKSFQPANVSCKKQFTQTQQIPMPLTSSQEPRPRILTQAQDDCTYKEEMSVLPEPCSKQLSERLLGALVFVGVCTIVILLIFCCIYANKNKR